MLSQNKKNNFRSSWWGTVSERLQQSTWQLPIRIDWLELCWLLRSPAGSDFSPVNRISRTHAGRILSKGRSYVVRLSAAFCFSFDKINNIDTRVLICHGDVDEVIPLSHGLALYEKLKNPVPPLIVHGANHHTILSGKYIHVFTRIAK